jgi:hypothetical protein
MIIANKLRDTAEATAAPTILSEGIRTMLKVTFTATETKATHIISLDLPKAISVATLGPRTVLTMKPADSILKAGAAPT